MSFLAFSTPYWIKLLQPNKTFKFILFLRFSHNIYNSIHLTRGWLFDTLVTSFEFLKPGFSACVQTPYYAFLYELPLASHDLHLCVTWSPSGAPWSRLGDLSGSMWSGGHNSCSISLTSRAPTVTAEQGENGRLNPQGNSLTISQTKPCERKKSKSDGTLWNKGSSLKRTAYCKGKEL